MCLIGNLLSGETVRLMPTSVLIGAYSLEDEVPKLPWRLDDQLHYEREAID
jgi:hypothetical protein